MSNIFKNVLLLCYIPFSVKVTLIEKKWMQ